MPPVTNVPLEWRALTAGTLPLLVDLAEACRDADGGLALLNEPEPLRERYFPDAPGTATGVFAGDTLVACASLYRTGAECVVFVGQVRPDFRRRGIGDALMRWALAQAALFNTDTPAGRIVQIKTESLPDGARRLYQAHGFTPVFEELVMRRDLTQPLPEQPAPPGITLTAWEPELDAQFFEAYHAAFRERPGFPGYSAQEWLDGYAEDDSLRREWSLLARAGDTPVGFVAGEEHEGGYITQIGVIPEWRRTGLAPALMTESLRRMQASGKLYVQLTVHLNNPGAIKTYLRLGYVEDGRRARFERHLDAP